MIQDPFEEAILEKLAGPLVPDVFEACVCDLLRDVFPSLAPIPGGSDAGMDGAIADGTGPAIPLVATTERSVIGNLTRSLDSYLQKGGQRRQVVVATSQALTARRIRNLEKRAQEKGFVLLNTYERQAWIHRLYRDDRWCRKLLGITGDPPALALVPSGHRAFLEGPLVGQVEALAWVESTQGDRVLAGPPGSGKTYLLFHLAQQGFGRFLDRPDPERIAGDLRRLQPKVVVVDDAHVHLEWLRVLRDLRTRSGAKFDIVAISWEGEDQQAVLDELKIPESRAFSLPLLPRRQIHEIVSQVGIEGPPRVIQEILDQAANRPGLAVTLAHLCLLGGWREISYGTALSRTLLNQFKQRLGHKAADVLAVLALGGKRGVTMQAVGDFLDIGVSEVRHVLAALSTAGVIVPTQGRMVVRPATLRFALVRDRFFHESLPNFDFRLLVPVAPHPEEELPAIHFEDALLTILGAAHRGGKIPHEEIQERLQATTSTEAWDAYAGLGSREAGWAASYFRDITQIAWGCLSGSPQMAIRRLLEAATIEGHDPGMHSPQPLRILGEWLSDLEVAQGQPNRFVERRRLTVETTVDWTRDGGDPRIAIEALCLALSPGVSSTSSDPVKGMTVTFSQGIVTSATLQEIEMIWPNLLDLLDRMAIPPWSPLDQMFHKWIYPESSTMGAPVGKKKQERMHAFATRMVKDLAPRFGAHPGFGRKLENYATALGIKVRIKRDPLFELLCPNQRGWRQHNWKQCRQAHEERVKKAAAQWARRDPALVAERLVTIQRLALDAQLHLDSWSYRFCRTLAETTKLPLASYVTALLDLDASAQLVGIFLDRLTELGQTEAPDLAARCLHSQQYDHVGFRAIVTLPNPPHELLYEALEKAEHYTASIETACLRHEVPLQTLRLLLQHTNPSVALAAAAGEWNSEPRGQIHDEIGTLWREAVLRVSVSEEDRGNRRGQLSDLGDILASDPELAFEWLAGQLSDPQGHWYLFMDPNGPVVHALSAIKTEHRSALIELVPNRSSWREFISFLVGKDLDAYAALLKAQGKRLLWLGPLRRGTHETWPEKAVMAVRAGVPAGDIAQEALFGGGWTVSGSGLEYWREKLGNLEEAAAAHVELMAVANKAREMVASEIKRAEKEEEDLEMFGLRGDV